MRVPRRKSGLVAKPQELWQILQPWSSSQKEGLEGIDKTTMMGLEDMARWTQRVTGAGSLLGRPPAGGAGGHRSGGGGGATTSTRH